jgi:D-xylose transport system ATP-binding protein
MTVALEVDDVVKRYGAVQALNHVSLTLHRGEILALLGDNGAGKSTLIKSISGAVGIDEGRILVDGSEASIRTPADSRRHGIETVYQDLALFDNLSVIANFFAGRELMRPSWPLVGWLNGRRMATGGQRQAVAVARAVHFAQSVVILDEPTAALGVRESRNVLRLIKRLPQRGISTILISHNLEQVMTVADRAVVLRRGTLVGEAVPSTENHDRIVGMIVGARSGLP